MNNLRHAHADIDSQPSNSTTNDNYATKTNGSTSLIPSYTSNTSQTPAPTIDDLKTDSLTANVEPATNQTKAINDHDLLNPHLSSYRSGSNYISANTSINPPSTTSTYSGIRSTNHSTSTSNNFNKLTLRNEPYNPPSNYYQPYRHGDYTNYNDTKTNPTFSPNSDYSNHHTQNSDITSMEGISSTYRYI